MNLSNLVKTDTQKKEWEKLMNQNEELYKLYRINKNEKIPAKGERIGDYEMKGLYGIFFELASEVYNANIKSLNVSERLEYLFESFNKKLEKNANKYIFDGAQNIESSLFEGLFLSDEDSNLGKQITENFIKASNKLKNNGNLFSNQKYFRYSAVEEYLNAYLDLCRFVFKPGCVYQEELRSLKIIEALLNIDYCEETNCFGIYSPFITFSILRTLKYIAILPEGYTNAQPSSKCDELLNSRRHIIATYAIRSFSRFTIKDGKSYVVEYSRRKDKIICRDAEKVSSIDNIKPIRLFEKITSHIYNTFKDAKFTDSQSFVVSVYGFCSYKDGNGTLNPAEIEDLIYEIFSWFEDKRIFDNVLKNKTIERLQIDYYLIKNNSKEVDNSPHLQYEYKDENIGNPIYKCDLNINVLPYCEYSNKHLNRIIDKSNIVFILDCPWLASEEFSLANEGNISSYSQWVNQASFLSDIDFFALSYPDENSFFNRSNLFNSINDQFNRLAVDTMAKYGKVVRVMKDYMLKWIQNRIQEYGKHNIHKTVYIYNSSLRGMSYSDYADYPIIREEAYSNKRFSIMRFSTRDKRPVEQNSGNKIYISLWNIIKYVDISFVYIKIKEYFADHLFKDIITGENTHITKDVINRDIISIMRNIVFVIDYSSDQKTVPTQIKIDIRLSEPVRKVYDDFNPKNSKELQELLEFFENIIKNVLFKKSIGLGDSCIRDAFEKSLYNQSKSVKDLFFLHIYSSKRKANTLSDFDIKIITSKVSEPNLKVNSLVPNFDAFSDKRAYQKLFNYLDIPRCPIFSINSVINQVDRIFNDGYSNRLHSKDILRNIKEVCEDCGYTESFLYENLNNL